MSQPSVKQEHLPANDSEYAKALESVSQDEAEKAPDTPAKRASVDNPVKRAVEEFKGIIDEMDDLREVLRAHGVPLRTTRMIVEFGVQNKPDKQATAIDSAMEQVEESFGEGGLKRSVLENHVATIVNLERDLTHARSVAREEGLDAQALSILTQMVQQNPGDGGAKAVRTFLGYALAYGVKTDQLTEIAGNLMQRPASVLPQIPRKADAASVRPVKKALQDAVVGLVIGVIVIYLLL